MPRIVITLAAKPVPCRGRLWHVRPTGNPTGTYNADPDLARLFIPDHGAEVIAATLTRVYGAVMVDSKVVCQIREVPNLSEIGTTKLGTPEFRAFLWCAATPGSDGRHPKGRRNCRTDAPCAACHARARRWWPAWDAAMEKWKADRERIISFQRNLALERQ